MVKWEFDVINLKAEHGLGDRRCFRWKSRRGGCHDVDHDGLESMLNALGAQGWAVVAFDTDSRLGSNLVLQREVPDEVSQRKARDVGVPAPSPPPPIVVSAPPVDLAPLLAEIRALRAQLTALPAPQVTVQPTPVHVAAPTVNVESVRPELEQVLVVLRQIEAGQPAAQPVVVPQVEPKFEGRRPWLSWSWVTGR